MKVETTLVQRILDDEDNNYQPGGLRAEIRAWGRLFNNKYRDRTMIGIFIMVFQRMQPQFPLTDTVVTDSIQSGAA